MTFAPTPVCVWPPFIWIVSETPATSLLNCTSSTCDYTLCWNATSHPVAVVARLPRYIPVPVDAPSSLTLFRTRRDFGITAAIVAAVTVAATAATMSAVALDT